MLRDDVILTCKTKVQTTARPVPYRALEPYIEKSWILEVMRKLKNYSWSNEKAVSIVYKSVSRWRPIIVRRDIYRYTL